jgi:hypothetical protein
MKVLYSIGNRVAATKDVTRNDLYGGSNEIVVEKGNTGTIVEVDRKGKLVAVSFQSPHISDKMEWWYPYDMIKHATCIEHRTSRRRRSESVDCPKCLGGI